jgi:type III secretion system YscD/HrpQ family protein
MIAQLVAEQGFISGLVLTLEGEGEWYIGRDPDSCHLIIEDLKVSRRHALCRKTSDGYTLENVSATNPIYINDDKVSTETPLHKNDTIKLGATTFRFTLTEKKAVLEEHKATSDGDKVEASHDKFPAGVHYDQGTPYYETIYEERDITFGTPLVEKFASRQMSIEEESNVTEETRWLLKIITGPSIGKEFSLEANGTYIIGSDALACDIALSDISISRKHASLSMDEEGNAYIEDFSSRNGVVIEGKVLEEKTPLPPNGIVTLGTTALLLIDKEVHSDTIVTTHAFAHLTSSPEEEGAVIEGNEESHAPSEDFFSKAKYVVNVITMGHFYLFTILFSVILLASVGTFSLFDSEDVVVASVNAEENIRSLVGNYPDIQFKFDNGELFILGHVTASVEREELLHSLSNLPYVKNIDDHVVIDEYVWLETNQILRKNEGWKGINMHSPYPGKFILSGYLKTSANKEALTEYVNSNFLYLDRLENHVIVEDTVIDEVTSTLAEHAFADIFIEFINGELSLSGFTSTTKSHELKNLVANFSTITGVRAVKNVVAELAPEESVINISEDYEVTGHYRHANVNVSVIINGRILARGDALDGMVITSIKSNTIFLEREGFKFKIDYNK